MLTLLGIGSTAEFVLPSGRQIKIEVTQDTASVVVINPKFTDEEYCVFTEEKSYGDKDGRTWDILTPTDLTGLV